MNATGNTYHLGPAGGLLAGCQNYPAAIRKAGEIIQAWRRTGDGDARGRDTGFWDSATAQTPSCYLHAAALTGLPPSPAAAWLAGPAHSVTPAEILATHPGACRQAAASLHGMLDPRAVEDGSDRPVHGGRGIRARCRSPTRLKRITSDHRPGLALGAVFMATRPRRCAQPPACQEG